MACIHYVARDLVLDREDVSHVRLEGIPLCPPPALPVSGDPEQEYFADGITEDIITDLSKIAGLLVIARNSSFAYKGKSVDIRTIGRELGVRSILEGSIRRVGNRVRITAQLINAANGAHLWADRYDRDLMPGSVSRIIKTSIIVSPALQTLWMSQSISRLSLLKKVQRCLSHIGFSPRWCFGKRNLML